MKNSACKTCKKVNKQKVSWPCNACKERSDQKDYDVSYYVFNNKLIPDYKLPE